MGHQCRQAFTLLLFIQVLGGWPANSAAADRFGDIAVVPQTVVSGETHHGYAEHRVFLSNESDTKSHTVALAYPESSGFFGERLDRLSRTVKLGPGSSAVVVLWQPPLPVYGSGFAVFVDNRFQGSVAPLGYNKHARPESLRHSSEVVQTIFSSRGISADDFNKLMDETFGVPFSPMKATGPPDNPGNRGSNGWAPVATTPATPQWLVLEYDPPVVAKQVNIHESGFPTKVVDVTLYDAEGKVLVSMPGNAGTHRSDVTSIPFSTTERPVAKVRLNVTPGVPGRMPQVIDAVGLVGTNQTVWAVGAQSSQPTSGGPGLDPALARRFGIGGGATRQCVRSELELAQWSDSWLAYSAFDAVLLTAKEYELLPKSVQVALWRYAECGGCLVTLGPVEVPEPWRSGLELSSEGGEIVPVGFGRCLRFKEGEFRQLTSSQGRLLSESSKLSASPWTLSALSDPGQANAQFSVVANIKVPFRSMVLILLVFVILIGPLNLIVLARLKRRIWSLWTIPLISFAASGLVFAYSFFSEGVTPHARREGFTLLDQVNHRATTLGLAAFYCPLTPRQGLQFGYETELTPILQLNYDGRRGGRGRELDWSLSQHLTRGWLASRVPAFFRVRKSESRRERIRLEKSGDGRLMAVNGLGAAIRNLQLTDFSGRFYTAANLPAGQRGELKPDPLRRSSKEMPQLISDFYRQANWGPVDSHREKFMGVVPPPGSYLAWLDDSPFIEPGLAGAAHEQKSAVIHGFLNPQEDAP